jgi:hypothetical protein
MLNSCAAGVVTVNIDNGSGAGYAAALIARGRSAPAWARRGMSTLYGTGGGVSGDMLLATLLDLGLTGRVGCRGARPGLTEFRLERQAVTRHGYERHAPVVHLTAGDAALRSATGSRFRGS